MDNQKELTWHDFPWYDSKVSIQLPLEFIKLISNKSIEEFNEVETIITYYYLNKRHQELIYLVVLNHSSSWGVNTKSLYLKYSGSWSELENAKLQLKEIRQALFDMYDNYYLRQFRSNLELRNAITLCQNDDVETQNLGYMLFKGCNINKKQAKQIISVYGNTSKS